MLPLPVLMIAACRAADRVEATTGRRQHDIRLCEDAGIDERKAGRGSILHSGVGTHVRVFCVDLFIKPSSAHVVRCEFVVKSC